jgi:hypothetical protein
MTGRNRETGFAAWFPIRRLALRHPPEAAWAGLLAPIYEVFRLQCTRCGAPLRIIGATPR